MGKTYGIKFKIWRVTFLKSFLPLKNFGMVFRFSRHRWFTKCALRWDKSLGWFQYFPACQDFIEILTEKFSSQHKAYAETLLEKMSLLFPRHMGCLFYEWQLHLNQCMRLWYLSHRRPAKDQASLRIRAVLPEPSLFANIKYGSRRMVQPKIRHLAPLDGCACVFEEWVYRGRKVP